MGIEAVRAYLETDKSEWTFDRWLEEVEGPNSLAIRSFMSDADHRARELIQIYGC